MYVPVCHQFIKNVCNENGVIVQRNNASGWRYDEDDYEVDRQYNRISFPA